MDRNELTLAIAGALITAFLLGWIAETLRDEIEAAAAQQIATLQSELAAAQEAATRAEAEVEEVRASYRRVLRPRPPPLETD